MAFALVANTIAGGTSGSVTTSAIDTTGATLIVIGLAYDDSPSRVVVLTDNKGNEWKHIKSITQGATRSALFYTIPKSVGSGHTFSNINTNNFSSIAVQAFSGNPNYIVVDQVSSNNISSTTLAPGSITPTKDNELIVTSLAISGAGTPISINASFTKTDEIDFSSGNFYGGAIAYLIQTTAAAANPTWTRTNSNPMASIMASFFERPTVNSAWNTA
jgi:hypothetical protein